VKSFATRIFELLLGIGIVGLTWPSIAFARRHEAEIAAEATVTAAAIYTAGIVLAGCAIGVGIYFGLRARRRNDES